MADGITSAIVDAVQGFTSEGVSQTKQLVTGVTPQAQSQITNLTSRKQAQEEQAPRELRKQQNMAQLRQFLSQEAKKTQQRDKDYAQQEVTSSQGSQSSSLKQNGTLPDIGLQTVVRGKHAETKGNRPGE